jgi:hypothetical protein
MTLTPAYGRDYKNRAQIITDLNSGVDFVMNDYNASGYCSVRDLPDGQHQVRDRSLRKLWVVNVKGGVAK